MIKTEDAKTLQTVEKIKEVMPMLVFDAQERFKKAYNYINAINNDITDFIMDVLPSEAKYDAVIEKIYTIIRVQEVLEAFLAETDFKHIDKLIESFEQLELIDYSNLINGIEEE